ncbi:MAG: U32 family peptidase [Spirochaetales bacterium]|nr:MAG: U32 family peptidase [Spirochaetales bacterium]
MDPVTRTDIEIMAPAGSFEALAAAIRAGADSVYFGAGGLNMRQASAVNFGLADMEKIARATSRAGVRSYLAVNSTLYDDDLPAMRSLLRAAKDSGIDAVIASDQAAISCAADLGLEIHLSTQLSISNAESLRFYGRWADVVVLARELNLEQVAGIHRAIADGPILGPSGRPVRIELFAHGALCMAISGKCHLSLHQYGKSANRGACLQACRRSYLLADGETGDELAVNGEYLLSPKDLKTIHFLDRVIGAGVRVLKIEGRARPPEYVQATVECYREAVESIVDDSYGPEKIDDWNRRLSAVFNRGFWDGYYLGRRLGEWTDGYGSAATRKRVYVGKCTNWYGRTGVGSFMIESEHIAPGDQLLVTGPTTGALIVTPDEIWIDDSTAARAGRGTEPSFRVERKVRRGDRLYRLVEAAASAAP